MDIRSVIPGAKTHFKGFFQFVREQGIAGFAVGFILGGSIKDVVSSFVADIVQPIIGLIFGSTSGLKSFHYNSIMYGNFISIVIDFLIVAAVVYIVFKVLRLDRLDKKKEDATQ